VLQDRPHPGLLTSTVLFREEQRFGDRRLRLLLAGSVAALVTALLALGPRTDAPAGLPGWLALGGTALALLAMLGLSLGTRLVTELRREGLLVQLTPFHRVPRRIPFEHATRVEAVTYAPLREYRGWGLRRGATGRAYSAWGDRGVLLTFSDGHTVLVGSQRADQLAAALRALKGPSAGPRTPG
jgi:hypothetical protein